MSSAVDLKTKEEKDAELDRRIEALRKKNEALVKRYQEIEEDKKKAEQEGIAVTTPRKPRSQEAETDKRKTEKENVTVTVEQSKAPTEKRVSNDWKPGTPLGRKTSEGNVTQRGSSDGRSPPRRTGSGRVARGGQRGGGGGGGRQERRELGMPRDGDIGDSGGQGRRGGRRGRGGGGGGETTPGGIDRKSKEWEEKRRQNIEKMKEEMEKIAEYERGQRVEGDKPIRNFLDDPRRTGPVSDSDRKEGSRRHVRNWGGLDFENVKTGPELEKEWTSRRPGPKGSMDMTMSMTGRERAEYLRWKKEREQIDEERLARHRNATGQWRREWDAQKTDNMFKEDPCASAEGIATEQGGGKRDEHKRPPKAPTFGDFLSQGRTPGSRGEGRRGRTRGQKQSYSMHDNRWEGEKKDNNEEEGKEEKEEKEEEEDRTKREEKGKKREKEPDNKPAAVQKTEKKIEDEDDDDDEWEDASDGEEGDALDEGSDSECEEKKDTEKEKRSPVSAGSPKEQRTPRPKIHIPPPAQDAPEKGKPVSPFSLLDSHRPVSDWAEEMEMQSPRSSMGAESPLKPPSVDSSPSQKTGQEDEDQRSRKDADPRGKESTAEDVSPPRKEPEPQPSEKAPEEEPEPTRTDEPAAEPLAPSEVSDPAPSTLSEPVASKDQEESSEESPAASSSDELESAPPDAARDEGQNVDADAAPTAVSEQPLEPTVSG